MPPKKEPDSGTPSKEQDTKEQRGEEEGEVEHMIVLAGFLDPNGEIWKITPPESRLRNWQSDPNTLKTMLAMSMAGTDVLFEDKNKKDKKE